LPISATDAINPAFEYTKRMLFRPFRFALWVRLAIVGFLAGELSGGGGGFNLPRSFTHHPAHTHGGSGGGTVATAGVMHPWIIPLIIGVALVGIAVTFAFLYISSIMRFVLFDSVLSGECHISRDWTRRREPGRRLFGWAITYLLMVWGTMLILLVIPALAAYWFGWFIHPKEHILALVFAGLFLLILFFAIALIGGLVWVMTKDFVVPQMALENVTPSEGWHRLLQMMKAEKAAYAAYIGMKIVLGFGAAVLFGFIGFFVAVIVALPVALVAVTAILGGSAAGLTWNFFTIAAVAFAGLVAFIVLLFALAFVNTPVTVFFPAYSMLFFASRYAPLASVMWPKQVPAIPQIQPPLPNTPLA